MKKIKLTKGQFTIVDDDMFDYLNQWKWYLNNDGYAVRSKRVFNGKKHIFMHRLVNNTPDNMQTDHINRDKLDNRNENLRNTTKMLNGRNRGTPKNNTSGYKGVVWDKNFVSWKFEETKPLDIPKAAASGRILKPAPANP